MGVNYVVQVVIVNAVGIWLFDKLLERHPRVTHSIELIIEYIGKLFWVQNLWRMLTPLLTIFTSIPLYLSWYILRLNGNELVHTNC
jgi:hypothetical protein